MNVRVFYVVLFIGTIFFFSVRHAQHVYAQTIVTEKIIYAVNADYAQYNPNWQSAARHYHVH